MTANYLGSTQGSSSANPPQMLHSVIGGRIQNPGLTSTVGSTGALGGKLWFYSSTNTAEDMIALGVITDGGLLGMRPGDFLFGVLSSDYSSTQSQIYIGTLVSTVPTTGGYSLSSNYLCSSNKTSG